MQEIIDKYITYRRTGTETEAFVKPVFPENSDEDKITQTLVTACKEKGVTLHILKI